MSKNARLNSQYSALQGAYWMSFGIARGIGSLCYAIIVAAMGVAMALPAIKRTR